MKFNNFLLIFIHFLKDMIKLKELNHIEKKKFASCEV